MSDDDKRWDDRTDRMTFEVRRGDATVSSVWTNSVGNAFRKQAGLAKLQGLGRRTRLQIVLTRAGILGLRSRLARSGPGGPAQPLQVSRLHRHASCLTCATSPHPTPSLALGPEIVLTRAGILGLR